MAMNGTNDNNGPIARIIKAATKIEANELRATILSFLFVFTLMAAYFILRPVRDALSSDWSDAELSWLWTSTFFFSFVAVSVYGAVISRVQFKNLVPSVYAFFSFSFFVFYFGSSFVENPVYIDKSFYVWLSVFSLFHVSVFWSFMSDLFSRDQAPRLFGIIATGASTGAIVGPTIPTFFADSLGATNLMLIAAVMLLIPIVIIRELEKLKITELGNEDVHADLSAQQAIGKNPFAGFELFFRKPFLLGIGLFILLYVAISTFVYFEIKNLLVDVDRDARMQIWGGIDLAVNSLAIVTAVFATGRLATKFGMSVTLALIPALIVFGLLIVAIAPVIAVVAGLQIVRRAGNYAITRPGREMLFTVVDRETRFKAKPVIDIVVYRGGDMVTAWGFTALTAGLGLGLGAVAAIGAGIAAVWAVVGVYLGRSYHRAAAAADAAVVPVEQ
jgi:AAA family ATP:ADP antiporter